MTEDANVIALDTALGTRGRPGRGSNNARPSASARNLAPSPKGSKAKATASREQSAAGTPDKGGVPDAPTSPPAGVDPGSHLPDAAGISSTPQLPVGGAADHKHPAPGIPAIDWLSGFTTAALEIFGEQWEPRLAEFLAFLRRRVTGDYHVDEFGFDAELTQRFLLSAIRPIKEKWFRVEVRGIENIPREGGALVVSNHSGTVPVDALMTMLSVHDHSGRNLRALGADLVFRLPMVSGLARKGGATLACSEDAERMLRNGELVGVWPEGFKGIGKPYAERYKLQRFGRGGFVSAAITTGVPIVPVSVVGAEEIYPLVGNIPSLARLLGVPYIPITPFFPLLGPLGMVPLPSKWIIDFGEPIRTDEYEKTEADDPMLVFNLTDQVREAIQQRLYGLLSQRPSVFG